MSSQYTPKEQTREPSQTTELPPLAKAASDAPRISEVRLGAREAQLLQSVWDWHEQSTKSRIVLGQPIVN